MRVAWGREGRDANGGETIEVHSTAQCNCGCTGKITNINEVTNTNRTISRFKLLRTNNTNNVFHQLGSLGRVGLVVAMSV